MCHVSDTNHLIEQQNANNNMILADILYNTSKNKTFRKWSKRVLDYETPWTENEIIYFRKALGSSGFKDRELAKVLLNAFENVLSRVSYKITPEQTDKGIAYIKNACFRRNGTLRRAKTNPFGQREAEIILNFSHFEFVGLNNTSFTGYAFYVPIYKVVARDGSSFEYTTNMGRMEIVG